jgi:tRNA pseudouridine(38-40) synthase
MMAKVWAPAGVRKPPLIFYLTFIMRMSRSARLLANSLHFAAKAFLHNQVRIIVDTLLDIGRGHKTLETLDQALLTGNRRLAWATRPPQGLTLVGVVYG